MSLLVAPDGVTDARQTRLPLTAAQVRWFIDGADFLRMVPQLAGLRLRAVCLRCLDTDGDGSVVATDQPDAGRILVSCGHRSGRVLTHERLSLQLLLLALGWGLRCTACGQPVRGDNDPADPVFTITCPCAVRAYQRMAALAG